jgi:hypothetical protein
MDGTLERLKRETLEWIGVADPAEFRRTAPLPESAYQLVDGIVSLTGLRRHPLHRSEDIAPFFIVGCGRSGTTLVRRITTAHPRLHVPPETRIALAVRIYRRNQRMRWEDLVRVTLAAYAMTSEFRNFQVQLAPVFRQVRRLPRSERSLARMLDILYRQHAALGGVDLHTWGDKTPSNARFLDRLHSVFPRMRVIHVLRDGVDVVHSLTEAGIAPDHQSAALRWRNEALSAHRWIARHPDRAITVRYERLVSHPEGVARGICLHLGVDYDPSMLIDLSGIADVHRIEHMERVMLPITGDRVGRGRAALGSNRALSRVMDKALVELGYPRIR